MNINVIPTDKPSRLFIHNAFNDLRFSKTEISKRDTHTPKNIYITNDEKPKEGDWCIDEKENIVKADKDFIFNCSHEFNEFWKKIILTTDVDLIKDGVQSIPDDFLEWFIKNPSCEFVKTDSYKTIYHTWLHKIILPKEEPKQELRKVCKCKKAYINPLSGICSLCWNEKFPDEKDDIKEEDLLEPKQETLEEAAEIYAKQFDWAEDSSPQLDFIEGAKWQQKRSGVKNPTSAFVAGVKWQQERSYSEEEVLELLQDFANDLSDNVINIKFWFKKFKKK